MLNDNFMNNFEMQLIKQCIERSPNQKCIYICSPLSAEDTKGIIENMQKAREYMYYTYRYMGKIACAPHAFLPALLNDNSQSERTLALQIGLKLLNQCEEIFVCGTRISNGMRGEILHALKRNIAVRVFDINVFMAVSKIIKENNVSNARLIYDRENISLSLSAGMYIGDYSNEVEFRYSRG